MLVLVIDTSGPECAAGIYDSGAEVMLASVSETIGKGHAEKLMGQVETALAQANLKLANLDRIAVTIGPGSFTGIRVGVAAARGFAVALKIPAVGVSTLSVVAESVLEIAPPVPVLAAIDARRDEIYAQVFAPDGETLTDPEAWRYDDVRAMAKRFDAIVTGSGGRILEGAASPQIDAMPLAIIGRIGARLAEDTKASPLYIRGADAKPQTGFALKHA